LLSKEQNTLEGLTTSTLISVSRRKNRGKTNKMKNTPILLLTLTSVFPMGLPAQEGGKAHRTSSRGVQSSPLADDQDKAMVKAKGKELIQRIRVSNHPIEVLGSLWQEYNDPALAQPFASAKEAKSVVAHLIEDRESFASIMMSGDAEWMKERRQRESAILKATTLAAIFDDERESRQQFKSEVISVLGEKRVEVAVASIEDVLTYLLLLETLPLSNIRPKLSEVEARRWLKLATADNSVWRLIVLKSVQFFDLSENQMGLLISAYATDKDPELLNEAAKFLANSELPRAGELLEGMKKSLPTQSLNQTTIDRHLESLKQRHHP